MVCYAHFLPPEVAHFDRPIHYENNWSYIDIFQFRETDQNKVFNFLEYDTQFIVSQLRLTHNIINYINPDLIVVCNSKASNFFGVNKFEKRKKNMNVWLGYEFEFDNNFGVYVSNHLHKETIIENPEHNLFGKKFLFTSTLTYKSKFDKERLNWMINKIGQQGIELKNV